MLDWIRKNNKRILAIVGVFLMVAFIIPTFNQDRQNDPREIVGYVGDNQPLRLEDYQIALFDYQMLTKGVPGNNLLERFFILRLYAAISQAYGPMFGQTFAQQIAPSLGTQLARRLDPVHFMLLLNEARAMGVRHSEDEVEAHMQGADTVPGLNKNGLRQAIADWLTIRDAFERIASAPKISLATAMHDVVASQQQISLQIVDFKASDFRSDIPLPTRPQLIEFFEKYKNEDPKTNQYGIGYRYPNRVKVEYLVVPGDELKQKIGYDEIYDFYKDNPADPITKPTSQPSTTQSSTQPATQAIATTRPKEPPSEVREEIHKFLTSQAVQAVAKAIDTAFRQDWPAFRQAAKASGTTIPSTAYTTNLGVPFHTTEYLQRLQSRIQRMRESRGVLPRLNSWNTEFMSHEELAKLPGVGQSTVQTPRGPMTFPDYAINNAAPFLSPDQLSQAQEGQILQLFQPSVPFRDGQNYYIFRLTDAQPAHAADDLDPLINKVRDDWVTMQAYDMAKKEAEKFHAALNAGFAIAATTRPTTRPALSTGLIGPRTDSIERYPLPPAANANLLAGGFKLLHEKLRTSNPAPIGLIDLPKAHTVVVAQLDDAKPAERDETFAEDVGRAQIQQSSARTADLFRRWFDAESIEARNNYRPADGGNAPQTPRSNRPRPAPFP